MGMFKSFYRFQNQLAVITEDGLRISYEDLDQRIEEFKLRFSAGRGVALIECENSLNSIVAYLSALRAGCPALLVATKQPQVNNNLRNQFSALYHVDTVANTVSIYESGAGLQLHPDLAVILSTSGSTGTAKSIRLSYKSLEANARSIVEYLSITPEDRAPTTLPMYYSYGLSVINSHLLSGATLVLTQRSVAEPEFWQLFDENHCTSFAGVPHSYALIEKSGVKTAERKTLRYATQAGGRLEPGRVSALTKQSQQEGWQFFVMYGQTEATARMAYLPPDQALEHPNCIGIAIPGGKFRLINEQGGEIEGADQTGELVYTGNNVMMGYASSAEDLARGYDLTELRTGDLARRTREGLYYIVGRKKRFVKLYGLRISLDEVDGWLLDHGHSAVSTGLNDSLWVLTTAAASVAMIRASIANWLNLPAASIHVGVVEAIPRKANGKIDFSEVTRLAEQEAKKLEAAIAAQTPQFKTNSVRDIFTAYFPNQEIEPGASFASLGGTSLNYIDMMMQLEKSISNLPQNWYEISLQELEQLPPPQKNQAAIETSIFFRALSICEVVANHANLISFGGGAIFLLLVAGTNFARFQGESLRKENFIKPVTSLLKNLIIPYFIICLGYQLYKREFDFSVLFLFSNFVSPDVSSIFPVWFINALVQSILIFSLLFCIKPIRQFATKTPWGFGLSTLALGIFTNRLGPYLWDTSYLYNRLPHMLIWIFALGWSIHFAQSKLQKVITTILLVASSAVLIGLDDHQSYFLLVGGISIIWVKAISIPPLVKQPIQLIGASAYYIYLTHMIFIHIVTHGAKIENSLLSSIVAIVGGIGVWALVKEAPKWLNPLSKLVSFQSNPAQQNDSKANLKPDQLHENEVEKVLLKKE